MSILEALAKDHRQLEKVVSRLGDIASTLPDERTATFSKLQAQLQAHARSEEEVVYRRLRQRGVDEQKTLEAYEEHHVADILLQELASACPGGRAWAAKVKVLEELLRHHIKEEELNIFPLVKDAFDERTLYTMEQEFYATRHVQLETWLGAMRRMTPAFAGRAAITVQAAAGRYARRGELAVRQTVERLRQRKDSAAAVLRAKRKRPAAPAVDVAPAPGKVTAPRPRAHKGSNGASITH